MLTQFALQLDFQDPSRDWKICNSWFVKQTDFWTKFSLREITQPEKEITGGA